MTDPNSHDENTARVLEHWKAHNRHQQPQLCQSLDADEAAAQCLSLLTDPTSPVMPAASFDELTRRNAALLESPADEIRDALGRQAVLLEAAAIKYMAQAANATRSSDTALLLKLSLSASRSLVNVLGALHAITREGTSSKALIDGNAA